VYGNTALTTLSPAVPVSIRPKSASRQTTANFQNDNNLQHLLSSFKGIKNTATTGNKNNNVSQTRGLPQHSNRPSLQLRIDGLGGHNPVAPKGGRIKNIQTPSTTLTARTYVGADDQHAISVDEENDEEGVYAWGSNSSGQCGAYSWESRFSDLKRGQTIDGIDNIIHADLVDSATLVVTREGKVYVSGR